MAGLRAPPSARTMATSAAPPALTRQSYSDNSRVVADASSLRPLIAGQKFSDICKESLPDNGPAGLGVDLEVGVVKTLNELDRKEIDAVSALYAERKKIDAVSALYAERKKKKSRILGFWILKKKANVDIDKLGKPTLPECYEEIKTLLAIEKSPVYSKALQVWSSKETLFTNRVERKKKKVANLKNEIYQLIGFFSVFQGVLLTAVSQSNLLHCNNWWSPILLSLVASVVTIFGVVQKLMQIKDFQTTIHSEEQSLKVYCSDLNFQVPTLIGEWLRMVKVTVRNTLDIHIKIKEGNANVYVDKAVVQAGQHYKLDLDPNATYREYVLITLPDNTKLPVFSSDDIAELKEIVVKMREGSDPPEYYWEGDPIKKCVAKKTGDLIKRGDPKIAGDRTKNGDSKKVGDPSARRGDISTNKDDPNAMASFSNQGDGHSPGFFRSVGKLFGFGK